MPADRDTFADIARYYDAIMGHVDYDRWFTVTTRLATLLPKGFRHLDAACGTGTLLEMLGRTGWNGVGMDLSFPMLRVGRKHARKLTAAVADLRALPLKESVDYITCLFDSINFLLEMRHVRRVLAAFHQALAPNGLLYFDVVTERMVDDYYEGQTWVENNGPFTTTWDNEYNRRTGLITSKIRVNTGPACDLYERIYERNDVEEALDQAGFNLLGVYDAHSWKAPNRKTVRIDFVACKGGVGRYRKPFRAVRTAIRERLA